MVKSQISYMQNMGHIKRYLCAKVYEHWLKYGKGVAKKKSGFYPSKIVEMAQITNVSCSLYGTCGKLSDSCVLSQFI